MAEIKPHKNIRGAEYYARAAEEAKQRENATQSPILRLRQFVKWARSQGLCKSERDFERQCGLSPNYITNNSSSGKGNIGTEMLGRIIKVFPQLNLAWICNGEGQMVLTDAPLNVDYKEAYESAVSVINALNKIINKSK